MTLAYVFWHRPQPAVDVARYEEALLAFHRRAADICLGSRSYRVPPTPWMADGGYEDWYLVAGFTELGELNAASVDAHHVTAHDGVAMMAGWGAGGLYRLVDGAADAIRSHHLWSVNRVGGDGSVWQRQMVLSPAPEWCAVGASGTPVEVVA